MNPLKEFFEDLAQEWDSSQPADREANLHNLLSRFDEPFSHARSILDAGGGTGALIPILHKRYPQAKIISFDFAHQMCQRASKRLPSMPVIQGNVHRLPFTPNSFDAIISHNSFPHFAEKPLALTNFKRVLKRSGKLLIIHDISRERVNEIHANAQAEVIHQDLLPEISVLTQWMINLGFSVEFQEDTNHHYIIYAKIV